MTTRRHLFVLVSINTCSGMDILLVGSDDAVLEGAFELELGLLLGAEAYPRVKQREEKDLRSVARGMTSKDMSMANWTRLRTSVNSGSRGCPNVGERNKSVLNVQ